MNVDLSKAIEAVAIGIASDSGRIGTQPRDHVMASALIHAAFPLIVEALRVRARQDAAAANERWETADGGTDAEVDAAIDADYAEDRIRWLARIAQEAQGE